MLRYLAAPILPAAAGALALARQVPAADGAVLTFDDGPHPDGTPAVLEVLASAGARATFFMVGEQVQRRSALVSEVLAQGHVVGLHGHRHRLQLRLSGRQVAADLERG